MTAVPRPPPSARLSALALALLLLRATAAPAQVPHAQADAVQVADARIPLPPPGAAVAAAYFTLRNTGRATVVLTGLDCTVASGAMLHQSMERHHEILMRPVGELDIAPGQQVRLTPGGMHVMLHGLRRPLALGERVPLTLHFADGSSRAALADERPLGSP